MDRFRTALQLYKDQQSQSRTRPQAGKAAGGQALPRPIVYTRTRSLDIPLSVLRQRRVMAAYDKGPFVDAFKILRTQVMHRLRENNWNVLGVTSPGHGEGKTLTAVNLAVSLAMETLADGVSSSTPISVIPASMRYLASMIALASRTTCWITSRSKISWCIRGSAVSSYCREDGLFRIRPKSSRRQKCLH